MPPPSLSFRVERLSDGAQLSVTGEIDLATSGQLVTKACAVVDKAPGNLVLDFAGVTFLDSSGVAALVSIYRHATSHQSKIIVSNVRGHVRHVLEITRMADIMTIQEG